MVAGVDDHPVQPTESVGQCLEHNRHPVMVVDVEFGDGDRDIRIALQQFVFEFFEPVDTPGAQREVATLGGEGTGHPRTQSGAGTGDENPLSPHLSNLDILRSASTLPPV